MKISKTFTLLLVVLITLAFGPALAETDAGKVIIGDFLVDIAQVMNLESGNAVEALDALRAQGYDIPTMDLGADLTEGNVVSIAGALGQQVTSSSPGALFSQQDAGRFIGSFERGLDTSASDTETDGTEKGDKPKVDPLTKGNGLKKGLYKKSASEPV